VRTQASCDREGEKERAKQTGKAEKGNTEAANSGKGLVVPSRSSCGVVFLEPVDSQMLGLDTLADSGKSQRDYEDG